MGLYLGGNGHLAFFRRWSAAPGTDTAAASIQEPTATSPSLSEASSTAASTALRDSVARSPQQASGVWETTGFCTDLQWAQGPRLSLCLAFRDNGDYKVHISRVSRTPPVPVGRSLEAYQDGTWNLLYGDDDHPLAI